MNGSGSIHLLERWVAWELTFCERANRICRRDLVRGVFSLVSRLGDGILWYFLMLLLPFIYGWEAIEVSLRMAISAAVGVAVYKWIKAFTERPRPYTRHDGIKPGTAPLDRYSFPSGHTLHAVSFSIVAISGFPELGWLLVPFATLVAMSRVVLGLHYPTDVVAGATIGSVLGSITAAYPLS